MEQFSKYKFLTQCADVDFQLQQSTNRFRPHNLWVFFFFLYFQFDLYELTTTAKSLQFGGIMYRNLLFRLCKSHWVLNSVFFTRATWVNGKAGILEVTTESFVLIVMLFVWQIKQVSWALIYSFHFWWEIGFSCWHFVKFRMNESCRLFFSCGHLLGAQFANLHSHCIEL